MLKIIGIAPHPPIVIPAVGRGELPKVRKTKEGLEELSRRIKAAGIERLVLISPHGPLFRDGIAVLSDDEVAGDFGMFGAPGVRLTMRTDGELLRLLAETSHEEGIRLVPVGRESGAGRTGLDHGALVPLYYLQQEGVILHGLHLTYGLLPYQKLYRFGQALARAIKERGLPTAVIASSDLSHRLIPGAPAGYNPRGKEFDERLAALLSEGRVAEILSLDPVLVEAAGECGLRSIIIALGTLAPRAEPADIISYEGPFGVGYLVASIQPESGREAAEAAPAAAVAGEESAAAAAGNRGQSELTPVALARRTLEQYLRRGSLPEIPADLPPLLLGRGGAFVSLKKRGQLRGCIGTVEGVRHNLAEEIMHNAVSAAVRDPRFPPVTRDELDELEISVDLLSPMERIGGLEELDPKVYGVLVKSGPKSGLLLPDLEGIDTAEEQVEIAMRKGGISSREPVELYRFRVDRYYR